MKKYNKILIASKMFERAHEQFISAKTEMDYVTSLLMSGAVVGIIAPLLAEQGGHPMHDLLVRIANATADPNEKKCNVGLFRATYNSLKHTGNKNKNIKASEDIEFETDIKLEAAHMLDVAKSDFKEIDVPETIHQQCSKKFIALLESENGYA